MKQVFTILSLTWTLSVAAQTSVPSCMAHGQLLPVNNEQVITWKSGTANGFRGRAHVQGTLARIYPDLTGHHHFELQMSSNRQDTLELVYNEGFGTTPPYHIGSQVEACGDYVTSNSGAGHRSSPDGAILHWLHRSPYPDHDSGFLVIDGVVTGEN